MYTEGEKRGAVAIASAHSACSVPPPPPASDGIEEILISAISCNVSLSQEIFGEFVDRDENDDIVL